MAEEAADAEVLLAALDQERRRSEELTRTLEAAEHEAVSATERLLKAQAKIEALKAKAKGRKPPAGASLAAVAADVAAEEEEAMEALQQRIAALKASRDKLIGAFDAQAAEVERLSTDNAALAEVRLWWTGQGGVGGLGPGGMRTVLCSYYDVAAPITAADTAACRHLAAAVPLHSRVWQPLCIELPAYTPPRSPSALLCSRWRNCGMLHPSGRHRRRAAWPKMSG